MGKPPVSRAQLNNMPDYTDEMWLNDSSTMIKDSLATQLIEHIKGKHCTLVEAMKDQDSGNPHVYAGISGFALLQMRLNSLFDNEESLEHLNSARKALYLPLHSLTRSKPSFLNGDCGPLAISAVIMARMSKHERSSDFIDRIFSREPMKRGERMGDDINNGDLCDEVMNGRAGYLYTLLFLQKYLGHSTVPRDKIIRVFNSMIVSGRRLSSSRSSQSPLLYEWHGKLYYGAAHGMAGILYSLLLVDDPSLKEIHEEFVMPSVNWLMVQQFKVDSRRITGVKTDSEVKPLPKPKGGNFPSRQGRLDDELMHWCHGAPGMVYMLLQAHKVYKNEIYLTSARLAADEIWRRGLLKKGYGLCHGILGNAYAFLAMFNHTGEHVYLHRAVKFAQYTMKDEIKQRIPDRPLSLYEGVAGVIYFYADLLDPKHAAFPGFQI